jgi:hypothetical protein
LCVCVCREKPLNCATLLHAVVVTTTKMSQRQLLNPKQTLLSMCRAAAAQIKTFTLLFSYTIFHTSHIYIISNELKWSITPRNLSSEKRVCAVSAWTYSQFDAKWFSQRFYQHASAVVVHQVKYTLAHRRSFHKVSNNDTDGLMRFSLLFCRRSPCNTRCC